MHRSRAIRLVASGRCVVTDQALRRAKAERWRTFTECGVVKWMAPALSREVSVRDTDASDREALARSSLAIYSSEWAAESARRKYPVESRRVHFVNLGANLDHTPSAEETDTIIDRRDRAKCRLLFIGVDWARKGADCAVAITAELNARGVDAQLTIIGCQPPPGTAVPAFVRLLGFLSKLHKAFAEMEVFQFTIRNLDLLVDKPIPDAIHHIAAFNSRHDALPLHIQKMPAWWLRGVW